MARQASLTSRLFKRLVLYRLMPVVLAALPATAQHNTAPLVVGWSDITPLFRAAPDGSAGGFGVEVMDRIAEQAGFEVRYRKFLRAEDLIRAQATGEVDLLPAIAALPMLAEENLFSDPIAETHIRVFVRSEDANDLTPASMTGHRIALPSMSLGPEGDALIARNIGVELPVSTHSVIELLRGTVDGLIASDSVTIADAHDLRLDHRIVAVGAPLRSFDRVVTLNRAHAHLMPAINQAIAELEADGTLALLRDQSQVSVAPPEPSELVVGVHHAPPYAIVGGEGEFSGFAVDTLRNLAQAAGISLRFVEIDAEALRLGPGPGRYDMLTHSPIIEGMRQQMDFTVPIDRSSLAVFTRAEEQRDFSGVDSLQGARLGIASTNIARQLTEQTSESLEFRKFTSPKALVDGLFDRKVDAIIYPRHAMMVAAARMGMGDYIREVSSGIETIDQGIALRFGLGNVRERLNAVIPGYLASSINTHVRDRYFGSPVFWTEERVQRFVRAGLGVLLTIIAGFAIIIFIRHRHATKERRIFASTLVDQVPIGMVLLSEAGEIEFSNQFINRRATRAKTRFQKGAIYQDVVKSMMDEGIIEHKGMDREAVLAQLTPSGLKSKSSSEYTVSNRRTYVRNAFPLGADGALITFLDVTEDRRRMNEIRNLNQKLMSQVSQIEAANEELRAFAYATSHDLKAPTNTTELLLDELNHTLAPKLTEDEAELFQDLQDTNARMAELIDDVLGYTDIIHSESQRVPVDLNKVLAEILRDLRADVLEAGADIQAEELPVVLGHHGQMRQLFQNLIGNAVKFRKPERKPKISIAVQSGGDGYVTLSVQDNGIGMPQEQIGQIFTPFKRLGNGHGSYSGSGLGLAICHRIVVNHGGAIEVTSELGEGSVFRVTLQGYWNDRQPDDD